MQTNQQEFQRIIAQPKYNIHHFKLCGCSFDEQICSGYLITAPLSGILQLIVNGTEIQLQKGNIALISPGQLYSINSLDSREIEFISVHLRQSLILDLAARLKLNSAGSQVVFKSTFINRDSKISDCLRVLINEVEQHELGGQLVIESVIDQLAVYLLRRHINVKRSDHLELSRVGVVDRRLRRAIEFMHIHYGRELSLDEIAAQAYLSPFHFARLFKRITGVTPLSYLSHLRIERARELLATTDMSVIEISQRVGYASQSHFAKVFKAVTGLNPRDYREAIILRRAYLS